MHSSGGGIITNELPENIITCTFIIDVFIPLQIPFRLSIVGFIVIIISHHYHYLAPRDYIYLITLIHNEAYHKTT